MTFERLPFARYEARADGYCRWRSYEGQRERYVLEHRLLATLLEDVDDVGDLDGMHVHHRAGLPWLNVLDLDVPEFPDGPLLELREPPEHADYHLHGEPFEAEAGAEVVTDGGRR